jgi:WD40 repeat protein
VAIDEASTLAAGPPTATEVGGPARRRLTVAIVAAVAPVAVASVVVAVAVAAGGVGLLRPAPERRQPPAAVPAEAFVIRSPDGVTAFAYSADGRVLATAGKRSGAVRLWDAVTGAELRVLADGTDGVVAVAFAPDGRSIVTAQRSGAVQRWDATSGAPLGTFATAPAPVLSLVFAPDGRTLAGVGARGAVQMWDAATGAALHALAGSGDTAASSALAFGADGRWIVLAGGTLTEWDAATGKVVGQRSFGPADADSVALSPDGGTAAAGGWRWLRLVGPAPGEPRELRGHEGEVASVAFAPDGRTLASAGGFYDNSVRIWEVPSGRQIRVLCEKCRSFRQVAFGPGGRTVAAADEEWLWVWPL